MLNLVLLGPPGAGKGTQAGYLVDAYDLLHVSTGDLLREEVKKTTDLAKEIREYMNSGKLVPDDVVTRLTVERMSRDDALNGVILDGFPRTSAQAESLDDAMRESGRSIDIVLYLNTSEKVAVDRLAGRRTCPECKHNYHMTNMPPKEDELCDKCGVSLMQREDDRPETVKNRLKVYSEKTSDLIEYYKNKGLLKDFNGDLEADKLFEEIDAFFKKEKMIS